MGYTRKLLTDKPTKDGNYFVETEWGPAVWTYLNIFGWRDGDDPASQSTNDRWLCPDDTPEMEWVSVEDELPPDNNGEECAEYLLLRTRMFRNVFGFYDRGQWRKDYTSVYDCKITHWLKMIEPKDKR